MTLPDAGAAPEPAVRRGLLGPGVLVAAGMAVGQVLGYALSVLGARLLGPETFSELGTLLGLLVIGAVVPLGMQTVAARRVAADDAGSSPDELLRLSLLSGTAVTVVALLLVPVAVVALDLEVVAHGAGGRHAPAAHPRRRGTRPHPGREHFSRLAWQYAVLAVARVGLSRRGARRDALGDRDDGRRGGRGGGRLARRAPRRRAAVVARRARAARRRERDGAHHARAARDVRLHQRRPAARARHAHPGAGRARTPPAPSCSRSRSGCPRPSRSSCSRASSAAARARSPSGIGVVVGLGLLVTAGVARAGAVAAAGRCSARRTPVSATTRRCSPSPARPRRSPTCCCSAASPPRTAGRRPRSGARSWRSPCVVVTVAHSSPRSIVLAVLGVSVALCLVGAWAHRNDTADDPVLTTPVTHDDGRPRRVGRRRRVRSRVSRCSGPLPAGPATARGRTAAGSRTRRPSPSAMAAGAREHAVLHPVVEQVDHGDAGTGGEVAVPRAVRRSRVSPGRSPAPPCRAARGPAVAVPWLCALLVAVARRTSRSARSPAGRPPCAA